MADLPRETPIRVFPDLSQRGGGTSHDTTWGEFCDANKDGLDAAELSEMGVRLAIGDEVAGGGGAQPMFLVATIPADDGRPSAADMGLDDDSYPPRCTDPNGHTWAFTDDGHGEGRCYCEHCGADGDA